MKYEDCFGYNPRECEIIIDGECEKCSFYKPIDKYIEDLEKRPPAYESCVDKINQLLKKRQRNTGVKTKWNAPTYNTYLRGERKYE